MSKFLISQPSSYQIHIFMARYIVLLLFILLACQPAKENSPIAELPREAHPWTRWWWHGSAVTREGITNELEALKEAGFGGVEITPIYGVRGEENDFIGYLSPEWMNMLQFTLEEAARLNLGVDMATGTGWPFGGPWIPAEQAAKTMAYKTYYWKGGRRITERIHFEQEGSVRAVRGNFSIDLLKEPLARNEDLQSLALDQVKFSRELPLVALMAYGPGQPVDLMQGVRNDTLSWEAPPGDWTVYALFQGDHGKLVERAAPGGEGYVLDHFSGQALEHYLSVFDSAFADHDLSGLRGFFNDSYEVDDARGEANWTPELFEQFLQLHKYDLRNYLPALLGNDSSEISSRVLSDYRVTVHNMLYDNFTSQWKNWAGSYGAIIRNQAHGSPGNILDLYALSDIPETEGTDPFKIKFASSAANVSGKKLVSAESLTWLNEHFLTSLADIKENIHTYLLGGINHVVYHGTTYSPEKTEWPGRLFYAAVHVNDRNPWWQDLKELNGYISNVQQYLQASQPDNDLLVYFPVYDFYSHKENELLRHMDIRGELDGTPLKEVSEYLMHDGHTFDFISDRQLQDIEMKDGKPESGGNSYEAILIPNTTYMPLRTLTKLVALHEKGVKILFQEQLPEDVPGMGRLDERRDEFSRMKKALGDAPVSSSLQQLLKNAGLSPETLQPSGLEFIRKKYGSDFCYFIVNRTDSEFDDFVNLKKLNDSAMIIDPVSGQSGNAVIADDGIYLQLKPGNGLLVITGENDLNSTFPYYEKTQNAKLLEGPWTLRYLTGGPQLPEERELAELRFWTGLDEYEDAFSGTAAYETTFTITGEDAPFYRLELGVVAGSARIYLNDEFLGMCTGPDFSIEIPKNNFVGNNRLRVEISNLMANRISWMERNNIEYRKFYNINFPANKAENVADGLFSTAGWQPLPSGLKGPVRLIPLNKKQF